jgi:hypothetical protein
MTAKTKSNAAPKTKFKYIASERLHEDDELIYPNNFPFQELYPNWQNFDPNTKNPAIDSKYSKGHHGPSGSGKKLRDFTSFELAICLEWEQDPVTSEWSRCYNQFTTDSDQCTIHNKRCHKDGPNQIFRLMKTNRVGNWGMLKNTHLDVPEPEPLSAAQEQETRYAKMEDECRTRSRKGEDWITVWNELDNRYAQEDAIAEKAEKEAARAKAKIGAKDTEDKENLAPTTNNSRKVSAKTAPGIELLDNKAIRNPNQRGRTARVATQWQDPLEPIAEDETAEQPPLPNPQLLAPAIDIPRGQGVGQVQEQNIDQNQEQDVVGQDQNNAVSEPPKGKIKKKEKKKQAALQKLKKKMGLGPSS